jgi:hypothetical protein
MYQPVAYQPGGQELARVLMVLGNGCGIGGRAGSGSGTALSAAAALVSNGGMLTLTDLQAGRQR